MYTLDYLSDHLAVARLGPADPLPAWLPEKGFITVSRTADELSIVCDESAIPAGVTAERGWRILKIRGPIDFGLTGVLASVIGPLGEAGISIFAISTYDTDYILIKADKMDWAIDVLTGVGHTIEKGA